MNAKKAWAVCKLWPAQDTRLLDESRSATPPWLDHCVECDRKVIAGKRLSQLSKAGHVRLICEPCEDRRTSRNNPVSRKRAHARDIPAADTEGVNTVAILSVRLKIRAYLGKDIPAGVAERVRASLHWNVLSVQEEPDLRSREDAFHYANARKLKRVMFTLDNDFLDDHRFPLRQSPGLYVLSARQDDPDDIYAGIVVVNQYLDEAYRRSPTLHLQSKAIVTSEGQRIRFITREREVRELFAAH